MSRKIWHFAVEGEQHVVDLQWSRFTFGGKVTVDGQFAEGWSAALRSRDVRFDIDGKVVILRFTTNPIFANKQELYVDGMLVKETR